MAETKSDIHLYTAQTPNGIKISMLLEELGLPYKARPDHVDSSTQRSC
jgi:glutathione S-transferase